LAIYSKAAGMKHSISPHKFRHFLFTWLKKQGIEDTLIQPYSGHESRQSLEIYSKLSIGDSQESYENVITKFPVLKEIQINLAPKRPFLNGGPISKIL
jgi:integrase/recombinase XerD